MTNNSFRERTFEMIQAVGTAVFPQRMLREYPGAYTQVTSYVAQEMDATVAKLLVILAAQPLEKKSYRWPADWWEAVKERWAPEWVKHRWPVRYQTAGWDIHALAEKIDVPKHLGSGHIVIREIDYTSELGDLYD